MKSMYIINKTCFRCVQSRGNWWGVIKNNSAHVICVRRPSWLFCHRTTESLVTGDVSKGKMVQEREK